MKNKLPIIFCLSLLCSQLVLVGLKLCKLISLSWVAVFAPTFVTVGLAIFAVVFIVMFFPLDERGR